MKPILVHVHVYYASLWPELRDSLLNIRPYPFELYVTFVERHERVEADIFENFPEAHVEVVENRGYDVAPFLHVISQVQLDDYSYVIKLHSKRDVNDNDFRGLEGNKWRKCLLAFLETPERFREHLAAFEAQPRIGMQADYHVHIARDIYDKPCAAILKKWLRAHKLPARPFSFVGGTMFIARAPLMKMMAGYGWKAEDFPETKGHSGTLAHVAERLLGYFIYHQGYILSDRLLFRKAASYRRHLWWREVRSHHVLRFLYQSKRTASGYMIVKVLKIPVYRRRIKEPAAR